MVQKGIDSVIKFIDMESGIPDGIDKKDSN